MRLVAQPTSFQMTGDSITINTPQSIQYQNLVVNNHNKILALGASGTNVNIQNHIIDITNGVGNNVGFTYNFDSLATGSNWGNIASYYEDRVTVMQFNFWAGLNYFNGLNILSLDVNTGEGWIRGLNGYTHHFSGDFAIDNANRVLMVATPRFANTPNVFDTYFLDSNGETIWKKGFRLIDTSYTSYDLLVQNVESHPSGNYFISGQFQDYNETGLDEGFILKVDSMGNHLSWKKILDHEIDQLYINALGEIYLLGKSIEDYPFTDNAENAVLIKLDENLNEVWTKVYHAENFEFSDVKLSVADDGSVMLGYSTFGAFPVILAKLNSDGEILWEKGYPFYQPQLDVMKDGSLLMLTNFHFNAMNETSFFQIMVKTDSLGNLPNCETFPTCLESTIINTNFGEFQIDTFFINDLDDFGLLLEPFEVQHENFCDIPPPPNPEFNFPDTICINSCETSTDIYNFFAHGIEWKLESQNVNVLLQDSLNFDYCFSEAGDYVLTQTVWFLGCAYSFEKNIFVKDLDISITPDFVLCNDFPVELSVESEVPLAEYLWNTGATSSTIEIEEIGEYYIEVSDGICVDADTINFMKLADESCPLNLTIPNVFTPDGDGLNDTFGPVAGEYYELERIIIFNRWGQKIYDGKIAWDGNDGSKPCPSDVFIYRMAYLNLLNGRVEEVIGEVTLVR